VDQTRLRRNWRSRREN